MNQEVMQKNEASHVFRAPAKEDERLAFTGKGTEYFGIWIVNLLLTILTAGIYSAWAKVRRQRYFYGNTSLAGCGFEYHGAPLAILKGRVMVLLFIVGYNVAFQVSPVAGLVILGLFIAIVPWLIWKSLQFSLHNSSYRGVRFGFGGRAGPMYVYYLLLPMVSALFVHLLAPYAHQRARKYQHEQSRFGATPFAFDAGAASFYKVYLLGLAMVLGGIAAISAIFSGTLSAIFQNDGLEQAGGPAVSTFVLFTLSLYLWFFLLVPVFLTLMQNLVWNHTSIAGHRFRSEMKIGRTATIALTNVLGVVVSLGLFIPFAQIRMAKYRLESMSLIPAGDFNGFVEVAQQGTTATGEGAADLLGFDLSL